MNHNSFIIFLKPLTSLGAFFSWRIFQIASLCNSLTKVIVKMCVSIIHDIMSLNVRRLHATMVFTQRNECVSILVVLTLTKDVSIFHAKTCHQIGGAMAFRGRVGVMWSVFINRSIRIKRHQRLDGGAFIIAKKILRLIEVQLDNMMHLREKIRVSDC